MTQNSQQKNSINGLFIRDAGTANEIRYSCLEKDEGFFDEGDRRNYIEVSPGKIRKRLQQHRAGTSIKKDERYESESSEESESAFEEDCSETEMAVEAYYDQTPRPLKFENSSSQATEMTTTDGSGSGMNGASPHSNKSSKLIPLDQGFTRGEHSTRINFSQGDNHIVLPRPAYNHHQPRVMQGSLPAHRGNMPANSSMGF